MNHPTPGFVPRQEIAAFVIAVVLAITSPAGAARELIDPKALDVFQRMSLALGEATTLQFEAYTMFDDLEPSGVKYKRGVRHEIAVRRPDRLHFRSITDRGVTREGWYDGKTFTVAIPARNVYAQVESPATLDELLDRVQDEYRLNLPIVDVLYADVHSRLRSHLLSGAYVGEKIIDGRRLDHVSFETTPADVQVWAERDGAPLPHRLVVSYITLEGKPEHVVQWRLGAGRFCQRGAIPVRAAGQLAACRDEEAVAVVVDGGQSERCPDRNRRSDNIVQLPGDDDVRFVR